MSIYDILSEFHIGTTPRAILLIILGYFCAKLVSTHLTRALSSHITSPQQSMLLRRISFYLIFILFLASAIQQLGFHISALLGATGILTVAVGIASQTSMSNIISGLFIIGERPFELGDTIKVNDAQGEVIAIDFLSVKIRTTDNTMIRIPNEILVKSAITNFSYFPIRRADLIFAVAYKADIDAVKKILFDVADKNEYCLAEPKPSILILGTMDSTINIQFSVWSARENFNELKNAIQIGVKDALLAHGIEMPSTSYIIGGGLDTEPLQIKILDR